MNRGGKFLKKLWHCIGEDNNSLLVLGDSTKYPYLYHGRLLGFPKGRGVHDYGILRARGYLRLEIGRHGGISQVGFLE